MVSVQVLDHWISDIRLQEGSVVASFLQTEQMAFFLLEDGVLVVENDEEALALPSWRRDGEEEPLRL